MHRGAVASRDCFVLHHHGPLLMLADPRACGEFLKGWTRMMQTAKVALFVDIENLISGAATLGLPVRLEPIMEKLREFGKVQVRRSFGDITKSYERIGQLGRISQLRTHLQTQLVQIEDVPFYTAHKNGSDIRLAVEAISAAFQNEWIDHFAIVGSDKDYIPLYTKLKELDRSVIVFAIDRQASNPALNEAADRIYYYEDLLQSERTEEPGDDQQERLKERMSQMQVTAFQTLVRSVEIINNRGAEAIGSVVLRKMQELQPDFELQELGFRSFKAFAEEAQKKGLISLSAAAGSTDVALALRTRPVPKAAAPAPPAANRANLDELAGRLRQVVNTEILKIELPAEQDRLQIYHVLDQTLSELMKSGPVPFLMWANESAARLGGSASQQQVFKMALSVRYAKCLYTSMSAPGSNAVDITGKSVPWEQWDDKVVANLVTQLIMKGVANKTHRDVFARMFFEANDPDTLGRMDALLQTIR